VNADIRRLLVVTPDPPLPVWGFGTRVYQLTRHLSDRHRVTLLTAASPAQTEDVRVLRRQFGDLRVAQVDDAAGRLLRRGRQAISVMIRRPFHGGELVSPVLQEAINRCISDVKPDIIQVESSRLFGFAFATDAPIVLDEHNVESELLERMHQGERSFVRRAYYRLESDRYRVLEETAWASADAVAVTSQRESALVGKRSPQTLVRVVPNGVDSSYFAPRDTEVDPAMVVFVGLLSYRPNFEGVQWFVDEVLPRIHRTRPDTVVVVVGGSNRPESNKMLSRPGVILTGWVPDVRTYLARAAVVVVPIRMGGGTRLKVVEALSMRKPVVSTALGSEGIDVRNESELLIADDPDEFAASTCRLLRDRDFADRLGARGRNLVVDRYSWRGSARLLEALHGELVSSPRRPRGQVTPPSNLRSGCA